MDRLIKNILWVTIFLGTLCICLESYSLDQETFVEHNNRTLVRFKKQAAKLPCKGDLTKFQCDTTGCINGNLKCDGKEDCPDGSDETISTCNLNLTKKCTAPVQPSNGHWIYLSSGKGGHANEKSDINTVIVYSCNVGYKLSITNEDNLVAICLSIGEWSVARPTCQKICPSFNNSLLLDITCKNAGSVVPCEKASDKTVLTYKCAPYYDYRDEGRIITCNDGAWDYIPSCVPVCGEKRVSTTPLIVNGKEVERGNFPWVVAIYSNKGSDSYFRNICSGSLIAINVVFTAAHCVTRADNGNVHPTRYYHVGAGKYYSQYEDRRDSDTAQYSEVAEIAVHKEYRGIINNFRGDIAMLRLKNNFAISEFVQPVCFKFLPFIEANVIGMVAGWGYNSSGLPSEVVKEVEVLYNTELCLKNVEEGFEQYFASDKFCVGFYKNTSVCKGDGGGGLIFKNPHYKNRYFIHGIVSLIASTTYDHKVYCLGNALYTKVENYLQWATLQLRQWTR